MSHSRRAITEHMRWRDRCSVLSDKLLGNFKAQEARAVMQEVLAQEKDPYTAKLLQQGLSTLKEQDD